MGDSVCVDWVGVVDCSVLMIAL